jgi:hypothetical protein
METQFPMYLDSKSGGFLVQIHLACAIHSDRKLSVSLDEDEGDALSKDLGMHGDVSCAVRRRVSQVRRA